MAYTSSQTRWYLKETTSECYSRRWKKHLPHPIQNSRKRLPPQEGIVLDVKLIPNLTGKLSWSRKVEAHAPCCERAFPARSLAFPRPAQKSDCPASSESRSTLRRRSC